MRNFKWGKGNECRRSRLFNPCGEFSRQHLNSTSIYIPSECNIYWMHCLRPIIYIFTYTELSWRNVESNMNQTWTQSGLYPKRKSQNTPLPITARFVATYPLFVNVWHKCKLYWIQCQNREWTRIRAEFRFATSQWETCNNVCHWLGASLESALHMCKNPNTATRDCWNHVIQNVV